MLVLSRKLNEEIRIGDDVVVRIVEVRGNYVRLGIMAPAEVPVMRAEIQPRVLAVDHESPLRLRLAKCPR